MNLNYEFEESVNNNTTVQFYYIQFEQKTSARGSGKKTYKLCSYSSESCVEVYCLRLTFCISKLVYCATTISYQNSPDDVIYCGMKIGSKNTLKLSSDENDKMQITIGSFCLFLNYKFKAGQNVTNPCLYLPCL